MNEGMKEVAETSVFCHRCFRSREDKVAHQTFPSQIKETQSAVPGEGYGDGELVPVLTERAQRMLRATRSITREEL